MAVDLEAREKRLSTLAFASVLEPIPINEAVAAAWAGLVARLRAAGRRMPVNDSWIAASALANEMAVVTQDDHFDVVSQLPIIKVLSTKSHSYFRELVPDSGAIYRRFAVLEHR